MIRLILRQIDNFGNFIKIIHMKTLEWRHYRIILSINNAGSLTEAAKGLNLTQSAATHQVKEAERRLGVDLVNRHGRSLQLTPAGESIAEAAAMCAPILQKAENQARELSHSGQERLRIAFGPQDGLGWVVAASKFLASLRTPMQLDLVSSARRPPTHCLRQDEADVALEVGPAQFPDMKRFLVGEDELVCILSPEHALSTASAITTGDIVDETYLAHSLVPQPGFELEAFFQQTAHLPVHVAHVESLTAIIDMVSAGRGVSIQPHSAVVRAEKGKRIVSKSLSPTPVHQPWYLHAREGILATYGGAMLQDLSQAIAPQLLS